MAKNKAALAKEPAQPVEHCDVFETAPEVCGHKSAPFTCTRFPHNNVGPHQYFEDGRLIATWN